MLWKDNEMKKRIYDGEIITNRKIGTDIWRMEIRNPFEGGKVLPGQFVNIYLNRQDLLLPRPISICRVDGETVTLIYGIVGKGTKALTTYVKGDLIRISDPLGNGYDIDVVEKGQTALLIGGGIGIPPLLQLAHSLIGKGCEVVAVLGFRHEPFLVDDFKNMGVSVFVATDSGSEGFHGSGIELIKSKNLAGDAYFACGPRPMLSSIAEHCKYAGSDVQVSMEERMGCGYGACVGCVCKVSSDVNMAVANVKVCTDGPVFWGSEVVWDE